MTKHRDKGIGIGTPIRYNYRHISIKFKSKNLVKEYTIKI